MSQRRLPAEIYWRRRLLVLAAVILLVWVALRLIPGGGDDSGAKGPSPTATPTAPVATTPPTDGIVDVALTTASRACDPEKVRITPTVDTGQYAKTAVDVGLVVSSTETTACTLDPSDADLVAVISANKTPIWDSTVCKSSLLTDPVALSPQWATLVRATWSGRGSGSACSGKEGYATPGTYVLQVGTLGGEPGSATFSLARKPDPTPSDKPTDKSSATPKPPKTTAKPND